MTAELRLTGAIAIRDRAGTVHHLPSGRAQIALARLALERPGGTSRHELADSLWPDLLPPTWESALRSVVSRVRAFVAATVPGEPNPLNVRSGRYVLSLPDDIIVDIEDGQAAVELARRALGAGRHDEAAAQAGRAVRRLRAPFLANHDGSWITRTRARLTDLHLDALEIASCAATELGHHGEAVTLANEAAHLAPLRESAHRRRIVAHAAAGNRAAALRAYHDVRRTLAGELGVEPSAETDTVYLDVLAGGPAERGPVADAASSGAVPVRSCAGGVLPFVGRAHELTVIDASWTRACAGDAQLVVIRGEPGAGKTRMAAEAARHAAAAGAMVLAARCDGASRAPCAPFLDIVEGFVAATPDDLLPRLPSLPWTGRADGGALRDVARLRSSALPLAARAASVELLAAAARERPLYLVLDDMHLADEHSLWMLRHLVARGTAQRIMVVATVGTDMRQRPALRQVLDDLERGGRSVCVDLDGLDIAAVRELRRAMPATRRPSSSGRLLADTAGNPFLLEQLLTQPLEPERDPATLPPVRRYAEARLSALAEPGVAIAEVAAVAGASFEPDLVARAADLGPAHAAEALDDLCRLGLVADAEGLGQAGGAQPRYRFRHDVVRRAIDATLGTHRRRRLHDRLASAIEDLRGHDRNEHVLEAARHRLAAGTLRTSDADRVGRAVILGSHAVPRREAAAVTTEALRLAPPGHAQRCSLLTLHGRLQLERGDRSAGATLVTAALTALAAGQVEVALDAAVLLGDAAAADPSLSTEACAVLADVVGAAPPGAGVELLVARAAVRLVRVGGRLPPVIATPAVSAIARELGMTEGVETLAHRGALATELGDLASASGDRWATAVAAHHAAMVAEVSAEPPAAASAALARMASSRDDEDAIHALLMEHRVAVHTTAGRFGEARSIAGDAPPCPAPAPAFGGPPPGTAVSLQLRVGRWLRPPQPRTLGAPLPSPGGSPAAHALDALDAGDRGRAAVTARAVLAGLEPLPAGDARLVELGLLAIIAFELGDPTLADELWQLLSPLSGLVCCLGYRAYVGHVSFHLGRLAVVLGEWGEAELHLSLALRQLAARRAHPWVAIAERQLATALDARRRPHLVRPAHAGGGDVHP